MLYQITFNQLMFSNDRGRERERERKGREGEKKITKDGQR